MRKADSACRLRQNSYIILKVVGQFLRSSELTSINDWTCFIFVRRGKFLTLATNLGSGLVPSSRQT